MQISESAIARAHRLGTFARNKNRPIIVKFACFKTKDKILSQKSMLKGTRVSLSGDFCRSIRLTRKKLIEFGKASGEAFSLSFNKLVMSKDKKTYVYCSATDTICEIVPPLTRVRKLATPPQARAVMMHCSNPPQGSRKACRYCSLTYEV